MDDGAQLDLLATLAEPAATLPPLLALPLLVWCFVVGACIGSFLNVVIARVPAGQSIVTPRSRCPKCSAPIRARDNLPLLSWVLLRGRCRSCAAPISPRYPFVELLIGALAVAVVARFGLSLQGLELFAFATILVAVAFVDVDTWTIPYAFVVALLVVGFAAGGLQALAASVVGPLPPIGVDPSGAAPAGATGASLLDRAIGAAGGFAVLGCVVVVSTAWFRRRGRIGPDETAMGWGDPLLLAGIGAVLGWAPLPLVVFLASLQGAVVGLALRSAGKLDHTEPVSADDDWVPPKAAVPFGPFLALGAIEMAFFGPALSAFARSILSPGA